MKLMLVGNARSRSRQDGIFSVHTLEYPEGQTHSVARLDWLGFSVVARPAEPPAAFQLHLAWVSCGLEPAS